jgi:hypothetical protein
MNDQIGTSTGHIEFALVNKTPIPCIEKSLAIEELSTLMPIRIKGKW